MVLLALAAATIAATSAFFSIFGLAQLFAGASTAVIIMASSLEFAKFVSTGFLYRYWGHINRPIRYYLLCAVFTLMCITSMGIYGFLSNAYQKSSLGWKTEMMKLESLRVEDARVQSQIKEIRTFIDEIPRNRISRKFEFQKMYEPKIRELQGKSAGIQSKIAEMQLQIYSTQTKIGPITYVAEAFGTNVDTVVKYLILLFVAVFDPLAVCLVFCWSLSIRLYEKYRGDESKIASRTLLNEPVDHRFRKAS